MVDPAADEIRTRAQARESVRDFRGALEAYTELLAREPGNPDFLLERGRLRLILGEDKGALADIDAAALARPGDLKTLYYRAYAVVRVDLPAALLDYRRAADAQPKDAEAFYYRGLTHLALNEAGKAHADFREALRICAKDNPYRNLYQEKAEETQPFSLPRFSLPRSVLASPATWGIAALNVAVMIVFHELLVNPTSAALLRRGAVERYAVQAGEIWRLLTAVFLHVGLVHLAWNTWGGIALCAPVEKALGTWRFLAVYLACGIGASAVSVLGHHVVSAGASGALFGIEGVLIVLLWRQRGEKRSALVNRRLRQTVWAMGLWFLLGFAANFDNWAHAGGLAFGLSFGALLVPGPFPFRFRKAAWGIVILLWIGVIVTAVDGTFNISARRTQALYLEITEAEARGDLEGAEQRLSKALGSNLDDAWILCRRGSIRERRNNPDGARQDYEAVLRKSKEYPNALWGLGNLSAKAGRHDEAVAFYDRYMRVQGGSPDLLLNRAMSLKALGRRDEAIRDLRRALETAPPGWPYRESTQDLLKELER